MSTHPLDEILDIAQDTANALSKVPEEEQSADSTLAETPITDGTLVEVPGGELTVQAVPVDPKLDTDFTFARDKMRDLIKKGQEAVDSAIMLAQSGDNPRAYEVVGGMITAIIQANKELITIHKTRKETEQIGGIERPKDGAGVNIERAVFVGKASDLLREIKALSAPKVDSPDAQDQK